MPNLKKQNLAVGKQCAKKEEKTKVFTIVVRFSCQDINFNSINLAI